MSDLYKQENERRHHTRGSKQLVQGYRVDIWIKETKSYAPYTGPKRPVTFAMAYAYRNYLKRGHAGGRVVEVPSQKVIEEWEAT